MPTDPISIHRAALAPLTRDFLATTAPIAAWLLANAPGAFVELYIVDGALGHVLVPAARWAAAGADVLQIEEESEEAEYFAELVAGVEDEKRAYEERLSARHGTKITLV